MSKPARGANRGYRGAVIAAMGGGHITGSVRPTRPGGLPAAMPTVSLAARRRRRTDASPDLWRADAEIALRKPGLIWGGRLHPLKARVLLEACLRAGLDRAAIGEISTPWTRSSRSRELLATAKPCMPVCHCIATTAPLIGCSSPIAIAEDQRSPQQRAEPSRPGCRRSRPTSRAARRCGRPA